MWIRYCIGSELGEFALNSNQACPQVNSHYCFLYVNDQYKCMNNKWVMAVICVRPCETEEEIS